MRREFPILKLEFFFSPLLKYAIDLGQSNVDV